MSDKEHDIKLKEVSNERFAAKVGVIEKHYNPKTIGHMGDKDWLSVYRLIQIKAVIVERDLWKLLDEMLSLKESFNKDVILVKELQLLPTCNGSISGRYVIHKTNQCCPLHGEPPEGGRLRVSIPTTGWEAAEKAISNYEKLRELAKGLYRLEYRLSRLRSDLDLIPLEGFYSTLPKELK